MTSTLAPDLARQAGHLRSALADGSATDADIEAALPEMVAHRDYPCLGARSVFRRGAAEVVVLSSMVDDHGSTSAARQHSGRAVEDGWRAQFTAGGADS